MMDGKKWDIDDIEVRKMIIEVLENVFKTGNCITTQRLPALLKRHFTRLIKEKSTIQTTNKESNETLIKQLKLNGKN